MSNNSLIQILGSILILNGMSLYQEKTKIRYIVSGMVLELSLLLEVQVIAMARNVQIWGQGKERITIVISDNLNLDNTNLLDQINGIFESNYGI